MRTGKLIILSAPSGAGKTTIMKHVVTTFPQLEFSISATSRAPRGTEKEGVDYYFVTGEQFVKDVEAGAFVEWEEVYAGTHYGTLRSEVERIWDKNNVIIFDIDVKGGVNLKSIFGHQALSIFIMPPSVEELRKRLDLRGTDSPEAIEKRVAKSAEEMQYAPLFDKVVINDNLEDAITEVESVIRNFIC